MQLYYNGYAIPLCIPPYLVEFYVKTQPLNVNYGNYYPPYIECL